MKKCGNYAMGWLTYNTNIEREIKRRARKREVKRNRRREREERKRRESGRV